MLLLPGTVAYNPQMRDLTPSRLAAVGCSVQDCPGVLADLLNAYSRPAPLSCIHTLRNDRYEHYEIAV